MSDIIDLDEVRMNKAHNAGHGGSFRVIPYDYTQDMGFIEDTDKPVMFLFDIPQLTGLCMSREDAVRLGKALIEMGEKGSDAFPEEVTQ